MSPFVQRDLTKTLDRESGFSSCGVLFWVIAVFVCSWTDLFNCKQMNETLIAYLQERMKDSDAVLAADKKVSEEERKAEGTNVLWCS